MSVNINVLDECGEKFIFSPYRYFGSTYEYFDNFHLLNGF